MGKKQASRSIPALCDGEEPIPLPERGEHFEGKRLPGRPKGSTRLQCMWDRAIVALLTYPTIEEAADKLDLSKATLKEWLTHPAFRRQLNEARRLRLEQAMRVMSGSAPEVAEKLLALLRGKADTSQVPAAVQLAAGKVLADMIEKLYLEELRQQAEDDRLREILAAKAELLGEPPPEPEAPALVAWAGGIPAEFLAGAEEGSGEEDAEV